MLLNKNWNFKPFDEPVAEKIHKDLNIHKSLCQLLAQRGVTDYQSAKDFFRPSLDNLNDPFLMKDMDKAVERITKAALRKEKIMVLGDYDVDGTTSVAVVFDFLRKNLPGRYEGQICYYIPHRYNEGYGLSTAAIDTCATQGVTLLITLDCGIKSVDKVSYAATKGIDVIVCDHHLPDAELPVSVAILNPKQHFCAYPFKELSGCGIGFKLIAALAKQWNVESEKVFKYLDLVATSIAADIVPLNDENRILAYHGLRRVNETPSLAMCTIKKIAAIERDLDISDLVFIVAPRINAAGRMDDANKVVAFFIEEDADTAMEMAEVLHTDNAERKEVDKNISDEALMLLHEDPENSEKYSTVLYRPHWHKGVVGIVASRMIDHFYRPTIILTESNGKITGSARSVSGFNIHDAIHECRDLLDNFGGHFFAAGLTMPKENLEAFKTRFENVVREMITPASRHPEILIDAELDFNAIKGKYFNIIKQFEPFGPTNMRPIFCTKKVKNFGGYSKIVKEQHIKFTVTQDGVTAVNGIGFNLAHKYDIVSSNAAFDMVYTIDENEWNGAKSLQIKVLDIRKSS